MSFTVGRKLLVGFMAVALLVVAAGVTGIVMVRNVVRSADTVIEYAVPNKNDLMEALLSVETAISESRNYLNNREGLEEIDSSIKRSMGAFRTRLDQIASNATGETRRLAGRVAEEAENFSGATTELVNTHNEKVSYTFSHKGVDYDLKTFLYFVGVRLNDWIDTLEEASRFNVRFNGTLDASESDFGIWYANFSTTDGELAGMLERFNTLNVKAHDAARKINEAEGSRKESYFARARSRYFNNARKEITTLQEHVAPILDSLGQREKEALDKMEVSSEKIRSALEELGASVDRAVEEAKLSAESAQRSSNIILAFTIAAAVLAAVIISLICTRVITGPLNEAVGFANRLADGDLGMEIDARGRTDETGQLLTAMQNMVQRLRSIISGVQGAAGNVSEASRELSVSSTHMSEGVDSQASRASQVATAASQMTQTIQEIAKNASKMASSTSDTTDIANKGKGIVDKTVNEVREIEKSVADSSKLVSMLGERSNQIGEIVSVINEIADQTNLLALNAAIEAARAGEQGRGFAVVADEVRKLAERTTTATQEISDMIASMQGETSRVVGSMDESLKRVELGTELSQQAGEALTNIVQSVDVLQGMVQQIASATEEMTMVSSQISDDVEVIASVTGETKSSADAVSGASGELARLSEELKQGISHFRLEGSSWTSGSGAEGGGKLLRLSRLGRWKNGDEDGMDRAANE